MNRVKSFNDFINESQDNSHMKLGARGELVKKLQASLENLGFPLRKYGVDGIFGPETFAALKETLTTIAKLTNVTQIVGDPNLLNFAPDGITQTQYNVALMVGQREEMAREIRSKLNTKIQNNSETSMAIQSLIKRNVPDVNTFLPKLKEVCDFLQIQENWLLLVMYKESKISAKAINKTTGASGLIQFMPKTATGLGTSVEAIRQMTATEQLEYVQKYLEKWKGKMRSSVDVYMSVFYPVAVGKPDNFVIGSEKSQERAIEVAKRNPAISAGKNMIMKSDFMAYVTKNVPTELSSAA